LVGSILAYGFLSPTTMTRWHHGGDFKKQNLQSSLQTGPARMFSSGPAVAVDVSADVELMQWMLCGRMPVSLN